MWGFETTSSKPRTLHLLIFGIIFLSINFSVGVVFASFSSDN